MSRSAALFPSRLGRIGIAWTPKGICRVQLPEADEAKTWGRLSARGAVRAAAPSPIAAAARRIAAVLEGAADDLADVALDLDGLSEFARRVYAEARKIAPGRLVSYGELARRIGAPGSARAVGRALGANPVPLIVPCHRVVAADGSLHGFSAPGGLETKQRLLAAEGRRDETGASGLSCAGP